MCVRVDCAHLDTDLGPEPIVQAVLQARGPGVRWYVLDHATLPDQYRYRLWSDLRTLGLDEWRLEPMHRRQENELGWSVVDVSELFVGSVEVAMRTLHDMPPMPGASELVARVEHRSALRPSLLDEVSVVLDMAATGTLYIDPEDEDLVAWARDAVAHASSDWRVRVLDRGKQEGWWGE